MWRTERQEVEYGTSSFFLSSRDTLNPLFTANRWDWQPHRKLGAKYLVMLCAGSTLLLGEEAPTSTTHQQFFWRHCPECREASITFWSLAFSYWFDKPWFHNWGKTCCCAHHTFLLGFPTACYLQAITGGDALSLPCIALWSTSWVFDVILSIWLYVFHDCWLLDFYFWNRPYYWRWETLQIGGPW
jgi:hypothetical protein